MGDETKQYKIQVKGTAYTCAPMPADDITMVVTVLSMGVSASQSIKALSGPLAASMGPDQFSALVDRIISKELTVTELAKAFETLLKRQSVKEPVKRAAKNTAPADDAE